MKAIRHRSVIATLPWITGGGHQNVLNLVVAGTSERPGSVSFPMGWARRR